MMTDTWLLDFICESNMIEGIYDYDRPVELAALRKFLTRRTPEVSDLIEFVGVIQPDAKFRAMHGMDVKVGNHFPLSGGPKVLNILEDILKHANGNWTPWFTHLRYENLHPFTDGNGRSGRALWLWCHRNYNTPPVTQFLQTFYYETLSNNPLEL